MKKILSIILIVSMVLANFQFTFAENSEETIYDESIDDYITIKVVYAKEGESRVQGIDSQENVVYDYSLNLNEGYLKSNLTSQIQHFDSEDINDSLDCDLYSTNDMGTSGNCSGPSSVTDSIPLTVLLGGVIISVGAIAVKLAAWIAAFTGFSSSVIKAIGAGAISTAANDIYGAITSGNWGRRVSFRINFACRRMWHSDPFDPNGGFYFWGQVVDSVTYIGLS